MARIENIYEETLLAAGTTSTIDLSFPYDRYVYTGSGSLVGNITITTSGSPVKGQILEIQWNCTFTGGGASVSILGITLNTSLFGKSSLIKCYYNGSSWDTQLIPDFYESQVIVNDNIVNTTIVGEKLASATVSPSKLSAAANANVLVVEISFEANEQCNNTVIMPSAGTFNVIDYEVIRAIAATDNGTITPRINGAAITLSSAITLVASTAINTTATTNCTANNTFAAGDSITFVAAKTTAGGKVRLSVKWTKS